MDFNLNGQQGYWQFIIYIKQLPWVKPFYTATADDNAVKDRGATSGDARFPDRRGMALQSYPFHVKQHKTEQIPSFLPISDQKRSCFARCKGSEAKMRANRHLSTLEPF
jgi:hypothetical protein